MKSNMENEPLQVTPSWGNDKWSDPDTGSQKTAESGSDAPTCSPIESAWEAYHGPIDDGEGNPYLPPMPASFMRGFVYGYEHGKSQFQSILRELCDAVQERLRDDPTPESRMRCWNAWNAASEFLENDERIRAGKDSL